MLLKVHNIKRKVETSQLHDCVVELLTSESQFPRNVIYSDQLVEQGILPLADCSENRFAKLVGMHRWTNTAMAYANFSRRMTATLGVVPRDAAGTGQIEQI